MVNSRLAALVVPLLSTAAVAGCGGGGDDGASAVTPSISAGGSGGEAHGGTSGAGGASGKGGASARGGGAGSAGASGGSVAGASGAAGNGGTGGVGGGAGAAGMGQSGSAGHAGAAGIGGGSAGQSGAAGAGGAVTCDASCMAPCLGGVCCTDLLRTCGDVCCAEGSVCSFSTCVVPGNTCLDGSECTSEKYCEPELGGGGSAGAGGSGGMCTSGVAPPEGKCLPKPPLCPNGMEPDPTKPITCVAACEFHPQTMIDPAVKYSWGGTTTPPYDTDVMMTPLVLELDDDNCNGHIDAEDIPEVVFTSFANGAWSTSGTTHALSIINGAFQEKWTFAESIVGGAELAGGNIDGMEGNEIVACGGDGFVYAIRGEDGTTLWKTASPVDCFIPNIADLDQDGAPEVIVEGGVLDGMTGALKASFAQPIGGSLTVADLDGDGHLDVVTPFQAFHADGSIFVDTGTTISGGTTSLSHASVVDLDKDGTPEVIAQVFGSNVVAVWRYSASAPGSYEMVRAPFVALLAPAGPWDWTNGLGPVTAGDFNGDGFPDVGFVAFRGYVAYDGKKLADTSIAQGDPSLVLWQTFTDEDNGSTGSAVFDFDGDGKVEVVYGDSSHLHIYEGSTGNELASPCNTDGTLLEYPVVADVDNDGHADLVVVSNAWSHNDGSNPASPSYTCNGTLTAGVRVFSSASSSWVRTRRVWNEHSYHVTNVEEDGSIPDVELANWTQPGLDNFRQNKQPGGEFSAPDAVVTVSAQCNGSYALVATVRNLGEALLPPGVQVCFFEGPPPSGTQLGCGMTTIPLYPAQAENLVLVLASPDQGITSGTTPVYASIIDPQGALHECRTDNDTSPAVSVACKP